MPSRRLKRIATAIKECASETILYKMKDPRRSFVTVTQVDVTADLRHASIYVSVLGEGKAERDTMQALNRARGFIQGEIARRLTTRFTPRVTFQVDNSPKKSIEISRLIDEAIAEDESRHSNTEENTPPEDASEEDPGAE